MMTRMCITLRLISLIDLTGYGMQDSGLGSNTQLPHYRFVLPVASLIIKPKLNASAFKMV